MQVNNSQPSFGMAVNYPRYTKGSLEHSAIEFAKPILDRLGETHDIKPRIKHSYSDCSVGTNHDVIVKTTVSKANKTLFEKGLHLLGLMPQEKEKSSLYVSIFPLSEQSLANYIIRDAQNSVAKFDRIHNPMRKKHANKNNSQPSFGNFSKIKKVAITDAGLAMADLSQTHKFKFRAKESGDRVNLTAVVSKKPEGLKEQIQSMRGKLPNVQIGGSVASADLELYPEKLTSTLVEKAKQAFDVFSGKRVEINS